MTHAFTTIDVSVEDKHGRPTGPVASGPLVMVGRGADCTLRIRDANLARKALRLEIIEGAAYAIDMMSTGGIWGEDGKRFSRKRLEDGERIFVLADVALRVRLR